MVYVPLLIPPLPTLPCTNHLSFTDVFEEDDSGIGWERDGVLGQFRRGETISLPTLACLSGQVPDTP